MDNGIPAQGKTMKKMQSNYQVNGGTSQAEVALPADSGAGRPDAVDEAESTARTSLFLSRFMSAWGDRMWEFAVTLILVEAGHGSIFLPASFGLVESLAVVLLGPTVGSWVQKRGRERLTVVQRALLAQNLCVALSALSGFFLLFTADPADEVLATPGAARPESVSRAQVQARAGTFWACTLGLILLGAAARVFSVASSISVDKEWATVVSGGDEDRLSEMNGIMRRIDLFCKLVAPALTGVGWGFVGGVVGTLFVSAWNCLSYLFEVRLLAAVFEAVLVLQGARSGDGSARKVRGGGAPGGVEGAGNTAGEEQTGTVVATGGGGAGPRLEGELAEGREGGGKDGKEKSSGPTQGAENRADAGGRAGGRSDSMVDVELGRVTSDEEAPSGSPSADDEEGASPSGEDGGGEGEGRDKGCGAEWRAYGQQAILLPMLALAVLYVNHLSFGQVSTTFLLWLQLHPALVGLCKGAGALCGVAATVWFPGWIRSQGTSRAGGLALVGLFLSLLLSLPVAVLTLAPPGPGAGPSEAVLLRLSPRADPDAGGAAGNGTAGGEDGGISAEGQGGVWVTDWHVGLLMAGIALSRAPLWAFDLAVTQLLQTGVAPWHRGPVNGAQHAAQSAFYVLGFAVAMAFPRPDSYGWLSLLSLGACAAALGMQAAFWWTHPGGYVHANAMRRLPRASGSESEGKGGGLRGSGESRGSGVELAGAGVEGGLRMGQSLRVRGSGSSEDDGGSGSARDSRDKGCGGGASAAQVV